MIERNLFKFSKKIFLKILKKLESIDVNNIFLLVFNLLIIKLFFSISISFLFIIDLISLKFFNVSLKLIFLFLSSFSIF